MKISFMTWLTPNWPLEKIVKFAKEAGYDGVELRVDVGHKHGISSRSTQEERRRARKLFEEAGVAVSCIATSIGFGSPEEAERRKSIEAAKENIKLASDLGAKVVRIFGGRSSKGTIELTEDALDYIAAAYTEVGEFGVDYGVCPLLEMHDAFSVDRFPTPVEASKKALEVLRRAETSNIGILWNRSWIDIESFQLLKNYIRHFHINKYADDPEDLQVFETMKLMKTVNFEGFFSLEHVRKELKMIPPEKMLMDHAKRMRKFLDMLK